jgi:glycosyltransferase involved in cell wall biosynthesis
MRSTESLSDGGADLVTDQLRVALVTACLGVGGGAEKQSFYIARALAEADVEVCVYTLRSGEYQDSLRRMGIESKCFGGLPGAPLRLMLLLAALRKFRPHIIQSVHAYTNFYSAIAGRLMGAISIGGLRGDLRACFADNGRLSRCLLTWPDALAVNSRKAFRQVKKTRLLNPNRLHLLPNAIELGAFPERDVLPDQAGDAECTCINVNRLFPLKRVDVFVRALAAARSTEPGLKGIVIGHGPEAARLQQLAAELGLLPDALRFLGFRDDILSLLQQASVFVFCSESEGTPNVILEAMAAGLPVITTPAGDAADVVKSAGAGYVLPFGEVKAIADAMVRLARSPDLRWKLGRAGRDYVARQRATSELAGQLMNIYSDVSRASVRSCRDPVLDHLQRCSERPLPDRRGVAREAIATLSGNDGTQFR